MATNMNTVDSLVANEFAVEINGQVTDGIFGVRGLVSFKIDENGKRVKPAFDIVKMVQRDGNNVFNKWLRETIASRDSDNRPKRDVAIVAIDDGLETRRWTVKGAYITAVRYSDYDTGWSEMVEEIYTIAYSDIEETWSATDKLE